jgi:hypothetical protein
MSRLDSPSRSKARWAAIVASAASLLSILLWTTSKTAAPSCGCTMRAFAKNLLTESLPYHVQRLKVCLPTSMPPHSIGHNLATEVSNLTIELKRKRLECVSSASSGSQADLTAELRRPRLERLDVLSRSSRPQCAPKLPLLRPRTHEECHPEGPLASIESWGSMAGPRLSRELLLERLETYRVCQGFRLDVEGELGEKAIDLSRFASEEVYGSYSRQKESMRGATRITSEKALRGSMGRMWMANVWKAHVEKAVCSERLPQFDYAQKHILRKGSPSQAQGIAVAYSTMVALYSA